MSDVKVTIQTRDKVIGMKPTARLEVVIEGATKMVKDVEAAIRKIVTERIATEDE